MVARKVVLILIVLMFGKLAASCTSTLHSCVKFETQPIITDGPNKILNFSLNVCNVETFSLQGVDVEVKSPQPVFLCNVNVQVNNAHVTSGACTCLLRLIGPSQCSVTRKQVGDDVSGTETWELTARLKNGEKVRDCLEVLFTDANRKETEVIELTGKPTSTFPARDSAPTEDSWQPTETSSDATPTESWIDNKLVKYIVFGCLGAVVLIAIVCGSVVVHLKCKGHNASRANRAQVDAIQMRPLPVLPAVPVVQDNRDSVLSETDDTYSKVQDDSSTGQAPLFKTDADGYLCPKTKATSSKEAMLDRMSAESRGFPWPQPYGASPATDRGVEQGGEQTTSGTQQCKSGEGGYIPMHPSLARCKLPADVAQSFADSSKVHVSPVGDQCESGEGGYVPMHSPLAPEPFEQSATPGVYQNVEHDADSKQHIYVNN